MTGLFRRHRKRQSLHVIFTLSPRWKKPAFHRSDALWEKDYNTPHRLAIVFPQCDSPRRKLNHGYEGEEGSGIECNNGVGGILEDIVVLATGLLIVISGWAAGPTVSWSSIAARENCHRFHGLHRN